MSEIEKYKKYLNFKANPRYLRRDFIVPLYTGTEPDIVPETSVEELGAVQEFNDGGSVERQGYSYAGLVTDYIKKKKDKTVTTGELLTLLENNKVKDPSGALFRVLHNPSFIQQGFNVVKTGIREEKKYRPQSSLPKSELNKASQYFFNKNFNDLTDQAQRDKITQRVRQGGGIFKKKTMYTQFSKTDQQKILKQFPDAVFKEGQSYGFKPTHPQYQTVYNFVNRGFKMRNFKPLSKPVQNDIKANFSEIPEKDWNFKLNKYGIPWNEKTRNVAMRILNFVADPSAKEFRYNFRFGSPDGWMLAQMDRAYLNGNENYKPLYQNKKIVGFQDNTAKGGGKKYYHIKYKGPLDENKVLVSNHPDYKKVSKFVDVAKNAKTDIPEALAKLLPEGYDTSKLKFNDFLNFMLDDKKTDIKTLRNAIEIHHAKGLSNPTSDLQLLTRTANLLARDIEQQILKGDLSNVNKLKEEGIRLVVEGKSYGAGKETAEKGASRIQQQVINYFTDNPEEMKKFTKNITQFFKDNPDAIKIARSAGFRCRKSVAGPIDVECLAEDVLKQAEKGTTSATNKILKLANFARNTGNFIFDFLVGTTPAAVAINFGINVPLAIKEAQEGKSGRQVLGTLTDVPFLGPIVGTTEENEITQAMGANAPLYFKIKNAYNEYQNIPNQLQNLENTKSELSGLRSPDETPSDIVEKEIELEKEKILKKDKELEEFLYPFTDKEGNLKYPKDIQKGLDILKEQERLRKLKTKFVPSITDTAVPEENLSNVEIDKQIEDLESKKLLEGADTDRIRTIEDMQSIEQGAQGAAEGGRIGFKDGTKIGRRGFLKAAAAVALTPEIIKTIKGAGQAGKIASKIKIEPVEGMYPWFPKLVEKVKEMGKPFKEEELIMEASYKNDPRPFLSGIPKGEEKLTKHVDGDTTFILREYSDGRIAVDIDSPRNQQSFGQAVSLYYRPKMEFKNYKGEIKVEPAEFRVLEPEPKPFVTGPDDVDITFTEVPKDPSRNIVYADIEAAERFATGKIKNRKIIPVKQSLRNEMEEDPSTFIMRQSGELGSTATPEQVIKKTEDFATGGRVGFSGGGNVVKIARLISEALSELKNSTSMVSNTARYQGIKNAKLEALTPYKNVPDRNKHIDILNKIEKARENLPREYHSILDDIKKDVDNFDYINADNRIMALDKEISPDLKFENLSKDMFPMEDPLNDAFIIIDPEKGYSVGRYTQKNTIDPETGRGIIQTFDRWSPESRKFLDEKDWKLIGVESLEKGKEGLN